ncbi:NAD(P)H-quinone oxidoreductase subunit J chloroplastic [Bienertia sinuspersici]
MQGRLSAWLVKHGLVHRSLGFDYQGVETLQIKSEDWHSIAVILYVYGYNYLRSQYAYDVAPSVSSYGNRTRYGSTRRDMRKKRESYDMLGISYDNHPCLKRILMLESWIGWPLRKDYIVPNFMKYKMLIE